MKRVVVGVDGSEHAGRALSRAIGEARLRGAKLDVVHVVPEQPMIVDPVLVPPPALEELHASGAQLIERALATADVGDLEIGRVTSVGQAARVLCEVAEGADLLVVGSRGYGGFRGLLVGSVTQQVVAHAPCPILVVVPEGRHARRDGR